MLTREGNMIHEKKNAKYTKETTNNKQEIYQKTSGCDYVVFM